MTMSWGLPEVVLTRGPPPQSVLDQLWLWSAFLALTTVTLVMQLLSLDVAGALMSGAICSFVYLLVQDGMYELGRYALVFAAMCSLCLFCDLLPLWLDFAQPRAHDAHSRHALFDAKAGFIYNCQGVATIASPLAMALGVHLSLSALREIWRESPGLSTTDLEEVAVAAVSARRAPLAQPRAGQLQSFTGKAFKLGS
mmetsp:Transcript_67134/g.187869  ORF Transcript_67134/g.187869 Transcript_67134/m.187869 type:complete len:197 (-) Transcript_67134:212-802(-)